jgi:hypothetical protein
MASTNTINTIPTPAKIQVPDRLEQLMQMPKRRAARPKPSRKNVPKAPFKVKVLNVNSHQRKGEKRTREVTQLPDGSTVVKTTKITVIKQEDTEILHFPPGVQVHAEQGTATNVSCTNSCANFLDFNMAIATGSADKPNGKIDRNAKIAQRFQEALPKGVPVAKRFSPVVILQSIQE